MAVCVERFVVRRNQDAGELRVGERWGWEWRRWLVCELVERREMQILWRRLEVEMVGRCEDYGSSAEGCQVGG